MCGIICSLLLFSEERPLTELSPELLKLLQNRGPDSIKTIFKDDGIRFGGFVLWQQGSKITPQPIELNGYILLLNGDIFNCSKELFESDSNALVESLNKCEDESDILSVFQTVKGPYSIIFYNSNSRSLYFARDSMGRNSLLLDLELGGQLNIMSTSYLKCDGYKKCIELPPLGIFKIALEKKSELFLHPWSTLTDTQLSEVTLLEKYLQLNIICRDTINPQWLNLNDEISPSYDFYDIMKELPDDRANIFPFLMSKKSINESIVKFLELLNNSVKKRVQTTTNCCTLCIESNQYLNEIKCEHAKVGILFSGGIDCTILAAVSHRFVDSKLPIDLINIAFESSKNKTGIYNWDVPDRCSARESHEELMHIFPERKWNLIEVNVTRDELNHKLKTHIKHLIYPLNTILDESLGCAFWFASRGIGLLNGERYQSNCRVLLLGSGADELFGGYTRHRNAYFRCSGTHDEKLQQLKLELDMDWERIPTRNLGRDDRVIADNKKTARAPFIEEDIVRFVRNLQPEQKCCFTLDQGLGDKLFLRLCGYQLGLRLSTQFKKRAIQFGSRIADKNQNAKDISTFLQ